MLPRSAGWVALWIVAIVATAAATSLEAPAAFAQVGPSTSASASLDAPVAAASVEAGVEASVAADPSSTPLPLPSLSRSENDAASASKNETPPANTTPPSNETPPANRTPPAPPMLAPRNQSLEGRAGETAEYRVVVSNPADVPQDVSLSLRHPSAWTVDLRPWNLSLEPGASATVLGTIRTSNALTGESGTVVIEARATGGSDTAIVEACFHGQLTDPCACPPPPSNETNNTRPPPPTNDTNGTRPPPPSNGTNETRPPPTNETGNGTRPPANETPTAAPKLSPRNQSVVGSPGEILPFRLVVENPASLAQRVFVSSSQHAGWDVHIEPTNLTLAPGERAMIHGSLRAPSALLGEIATFEITARGASGADTAYVTACVRGALQDPCAGWSTNSTNATQPSRGIATGDQTQPPPSNQTRSPEPGPIPRTNDTAPAERQSHEGDGTEDAGSDEAARPEDDADASATSETRIRVEAEV